LTSVADSKVVFISVSESIPVLGIISYRISHSQANTVTALKQIQSPIARSIDHGDYVAMDSLDLSAAFDVVNVKVFMKRLTT
jgi:hypothetical protein